ASTGADRQAAREVRGVVERREEPHDPALRDGGRQDRGRRAGPQIMSFVRPPSQPQTPAVSDCPRGWSWCTPFSAAMAASFDRQVKKVVSGCAVGNKTGDTVGGT